MFSDSSRAGVRWPLAAALHDPKTPDSNTPAAARARGDRRRRVPARGVRRQLVGLRVAAADTQPLSARLEVAGTDPSVSAKMVCAAEARTEIAATLTVHETRVTRPTWHDHLYSCTYEYPNGSFTLSVKELVSARKTTSDYFDSLERRSGARNR